jgi:hypothetical protein
MSLVKHNDGPERLCRDCEYFDGGGLIKPSDGSPERPKDFHGDCHNRLSPRFETTATDTCPQWFADTGRWPQEEDA